MNPIRLNLGGTVYDKFYKSFKFPSGELGVELDPEHSPVPHYALWPVPSLLIAEVVTPTDIVELLLVVDALKHMYPVALENTTLVLPYVPFGRQDRHTTPFTPFSLRVGASLVNSMGFRDVVTYTPHSQATELLIDNLRVDEREVNFFATEHLEKLPKDQTVIVAPDAGAEKRAYAMAKHLGVTKVVVAYKVRDPSTGNISYLEVPKGIIGVDKHIVVVDDICDGGATFTMLAKALDPVYGAPKRKSLTLFISHGIFSKGRKVLYDAGYDHIICFSNFIERRLNAETTKP